MSLPLKKLSIEPIPRALAKADRYRFLNEPVQAESICLDILSIDPENQEALVTLLLALTDQFGHGYKIGEIKPKDVLARLTNAYERAYYAGIVAERHAQAVLDQHAPDSRFLAHDFLTTAMRHYDEAAEMRQSGNDDALLRWNTCARIMNSRGVEPRSDQTDAQLLE